MICHDRFRSKESALLDISIHPGAAPLGRPGVIIAQEQGERFTVGVVDFKHANIGLVDRKIVALFEGKVVEFSSGEKDAVENDVVQFVVRFEI